MPCNVIGLFTVMTHKHGSLSHQDGRPDCRVPKPILSPGVFAIPASRRDFFLDNSRCSATSSYIAEKRWPVFCSAGRGLDIAGIPEDTLRLDSQAAIGPCCSPAICPANMSSAVRGRRKAGMVFCARLPGSRGGLDFVDTIVKADNSEIGGPHVRPNTT